MISNFREELAMLRDFFYAFIGFLSEFFRILGIWIIVSWVCDPYISEGLAIVIKVAMSWFFWLYCNYIVDLMARKIKESRKRR